MFVLVSSSEILPNFVFILTDDQDLTLGSMNYMENTTTFVADKGITFTNFFVNSPICCPSRSTILTGKYPHNTQVHNNSISGGCSSLNWQKLDERNTIASILKSTNNYKTFYAGKYLNQYGSKEVGGTEHVPYGYDWWLGLVGNSKYYNYTLSINGSRQFFQNDYLTDKITQYSLDFLNQKSLEGSNFFMMLAPPACHAPFTPAPRHEAKFPNLETPRNIPFNVTPVNKHWLLEMPPKNFPLKVDNLDDIYRNRLRTLQAVDEMVGLIIKKLEDIAVIDNTYVIITSDNGFHIGQFVQPWDKRQPYESDIRVPFVIRGPKIHTKTLSDYPAAAVDIFPTILDLANIETKNSDGLSFKNHLFNDEDKDYDKTVFIEYWGEGNANSDDPRCPWGPDKELAQCTLDSWCKCQDSRNNTYSCLLRLSSARKLKFCSFVGGYVEAYDLIEDPHELNNLNLTSAEVGLHLTILDDLSHCQGRSCVIKSSE